MSLSAVLLVTTQTSLEYHHRSRLNESVNAEYSYWAEAADNNNDDIDWSKVIASNVTTAGTSLDNQSRQNDVAGKNLEYVRKTYYVTLVIAFSTLSVIVVTSVTNLFAFIIFVTRINRRRSKNIYLANLSFTDLLIGLLIMPVRMLIYLNPAWNLQHSACRVFLTLLHTLIYGSLLAVVLVSIDRWYSICYPFTYRVKPTGRIAMISVAGTWVFSLLFHIPFVGMSDLIFKYHWVELPYGPCQMSSKQPVFTVVIFILCKYLLPHVSMLLLKISLYRKIKQRKTTNVRRSFGSFDQGALALIRTSISETAMNTLIEASNQNNAGFNGYLTATTNSSRKCSSGLTRRNTMELMTIRQESTKSCGSRSWSGSPDQRASLSVPVLGRRMSLQDFMIPSNNRNPTTRSVGGFSFRGANGRRETVGDLAKNLLDKQDSKAAWYLSLLLLVSLVCWTPVTVLYVVEMYLPCPLWVEELAQWLLLINSTANPFLYGLLNKEFRKVLRGWLRVRTSKMKRLQLALRLLSFQMTLGAIDFQDATKEEVDTSAGYAGLSMCPEDRES